MALYVGNTFLTNDVEFQFDTSWEQQYADFLDGTLVIPKKVEIIRDDAFYGINLNLKSVSFEENSQCTHILSSSFDGCSYLRTVDFSNCINLISVGSSCFKDCQLMKSVDFSKCLNLKTIQTYCFENCYGLETIEFPSSVTSIGDYCFNGCSALSTITINKPENSISGAPWGATNATVVWNG